MMYWLTLFLVVKGHYTIMMVMWHDSVCHHNHVEHQQDACADNPSFFHFECKDTIFLRTDQRKSRKSSCCAVEICQCRGSNHSWETIYRRA